MGKLNQVIAIEKQIKSRAHSALAELYKLVQKPELFNGFTKTYQKLDEEGEDLPSERKKVQLTAEDSIKLAKEAMIAVFDVTARKEWSNREAVADIKVGDELIAQDVPVTYLLFLEKELTNLRTFISKLPLLDAAEDWTSDENSGLHKTSALITHRTKKVQRPIVMYDATPEHPAQTNLISEDVLAGHWHTIKHSGAMPVPRAQQLEERIERLIEAVKTARETANSIEEVKPASVGEAVFEFLGQA